MNNPYLLTGVGILLTVAAVGIYLRWRRSPRGRASVSMFSAWVRDRRKPEVASVRLPDGAGFLTGTARRPIGEVRLMFGVWILIGIFLTIVSLAFRDAIQDFTAEWVPFPFLILGLAAAVGGAFFGERLDRPGRAERIAAFLSYRLGMDLVRFTCFLGGAVFFLQAAAAAVFCGVDDGRFTILTSSAAGILLWAGGVGRPLLARLFSRKEAAASPTAASAPMAAETPPASPDAPPAEERPAEVPVRRRRRTAARKKNPKPRRP
jgi:hypothetical protein